MDFYTVVTPIYSVGSGKNHFESQDWGSKMDQDRIMMYFNWFSSKSKIKCNAESPGSIGVETK